MSNSFIWNELTGQREPIEDRVAFLAELDRQNAEAADANTAVEVPALNNQVAEIAAAAPAVVTKATPALVDPILPPVDVPDQGVTGPVDMPGDVVADTSGKSQKPPADKAPK